MTRSLIPYPASMRQRPGQLRLPWPVPVAGTGELAGVAEWLGARLGGAASFGPAAPVQLILDDQLPAEGYRLTVDDAGVVIAGGGPAGAFYGAQTLCQLVPGSPDGGTVRLPQLQIVDEPRVGWRGVMLDVARHFQPISFLLRLVDLLAMHKLNVLHLHLTDDQGWRLPVPGHPRLTEVGAWRAETLIGHGKDRPRRYDGVRHGGHYSAAEVDRLVAYAADRFVTVLPEIDVPGHSQAAIAAYPELGNTGQQIPVWTDWGISEHILNVEDATVGFYRDVLDEVMRRFPGRHVHLGGDEVPTRQWHDSAAALARVRQLGLPAVPALRQWFVDQLASQLRQHGRVPVHWYDTGTDPAAEHNPPLQVAGAVAMPWHGDDAAGAAQRAGQQVVLTPEDPLYLDHYQSQDRDREPLAIGGCNPLPAVHGFEVDRPPGALGAQCQLWTEYLPTPAAVEYAAFPRLCAFSEAVWSPPPRPDFAGFRRRLAGHLPRLAALGVNYRPLSDSDDSPGGGD